ncbi:MAG: hypothetical protein D6B25_05775 [Desulfobulbaceae bacterium]|nr:MAG: hypothetical protein D6B25_05775 [Desulfobulbaceae bacterium]
MTQTIDIYCERIGSGFWAEPVNALTNLSFFIAATMVFLLARKRSVSTLDIDLLIILLLCIGIGSSLFHTFATPLAAAADVLPIMLFQITFLLSYSVRVMKLGIMKSMLLLLLFFFLIVLFGQFPQVWLNGSLAYFPALIVLLLFGISHVISQRPERWVLLGAALIFGLSLAFRSVDMSLCDRFGMGTHFIWHLLNGLCLYLCLRGLIISLHSLNVATIEVESKPNQK